jgi:hypothetical protein
MKVTKETAVLALLLMVLILFAASTSYFGNSFAAKLDGTSVVVSPAKLIINNPNLYFFLISKFLLQNLKWDTMTLADLISIDEVPQRTASTTSLSTLNSPI